DRKQSIYGFRGADVDVFQQTTDTLVAAGGLEQPLHLNFRSQPPLIHFFNHLFARLFQTPEEVPPEELAQLGYVAFEQSREQRQPEDHAPLVELLIDTKAPADDTPKAQRTQAERDAKQVARRILSLVHAENSSDADSAGNAGSAGILPAMSAQREKTAADKMSALPASAFPAPSFQFKDVALLFRAMTDVPAY